MHFELVSKISAVGLDQVGVDSILLDPIVLEMFSFLQIGIFTTSFNNTDKFSSHYQSFL